MAVTTEQPLGQLCMNQGKDRTMDKHRDVGVTPGWLPWLSFQSRQFINDMAKIYSITVTNAVDGVASSCRACALGSEQSGSSCVPCPPGHYIDKDTSQCKECPANTFLSIHQVYGGEACIPCGPGSRSTKVPSLSGDGQTVFVGLEALRELLLVLSCAL